MKQAYNPYLPLNTYIPDGEPHVFGDRVYIYGSHDRMGGTAYCEDHYEIWSASVHDLTDWRREGTSYFRTQDPSNAKDEMQLWAPDVVKGTDGRYYLYYCFSFYPEIGVAVSDKPAGPFEFYGHVHYPDSMEGGKTLREFMPFDPAAFVDDDGRVFLYYGFCPGGEKEFIAPNFTEEELAAMPENVREKVTNIKNVKFGEYSMVAELSSDMVTLKEVPRNLIPGAHHAAGTGFEGHAFFEASSMRKLRGRYYFVYSSHKSHELCYAISDKPDRDFRYGGTIISNGDIGLHGRETPVYPLSNNHGGLVEIEGQCYIFYHRATDGTEFSRQGLAERVEIASDGSIAQVEKTSCGLNHEPLAASGTYPAAIASHLTDPTVKNHIDYADPVMKTQVAVTEEANSSLIHRIKDRTIVGYKYFDFAEPKALLLELRGDFVGTVTIALDEAGKEVVGTLEINAPGERWTVCQTPLSPITGTRPLYLHFSGEKEAALKTIGFLN